MAATHSELDYLSEMKDIDLADTLTGGDLFFAESPARPQTQNRQERRSEAAAAPSTKEEDVVSAERYQEVLENRFMDLRKLYYHTKEQKQISQQRVRELEAMNAEKDGLIEQLTTQIRQGRASTSSQPRRSVLANISSNVTPNEQDAKERRSTSCTQSTQRLQQENTALKEKLKALQSWAAAIKPPPAAAMQL